MSVIPSLSSLKRKCVQVVKKHKPHLKNRTNCETCGNHLTKEDKNQKQHLFPDWTYDLIPDRTKVDEPELVRFPIDNHLDASQAERVTIMPSGTFSNFWCKECENESSLLDTWAKKVMFGKSTVLKPGLKQFDVFKSASQYRNYKKRIQRKRQIRLYRKDSKLLYRWLSSLLLRVLIVDYDGPEFDLIKKELIKASNNGFQNSFDLFVAMDENQTIDNIGQVTVVGENSNPGSLKIHLSIGGLLAVFNFGSITTEIKVREPHRKHDTQVFKLDSKKSKIVLVENLMIGEVQSLIEDKNKGSSIVTFSDFLRIILRK